MPMIKETYKFQNYTGMFGTYILNKEDSDDQNINSVSLSLRDYKR